MEEEDARDALDQAGLALVAKNRPLRRPDGTVEGEIDLVFTLEGYTFVIEVSTNAQRDTKREKRKKLRELAASGRLAAMSSELGLPESNALRLVYIDLSELGSEDLPVLDGITMLGAGNMDELMQDPEDGLEAFLHWCRI